MDFFRIIHYAQCVIWRKKIFFFFSHCEVLILTYLDFIKIQILLVILIGELDYGNLIIKGLEEKPAEGSMLERKTSLKANFTIQIL